jgi:hypothetical protein
VPSADREGRGPHRVRGASLRGLSIAPICSDGKQASCVRQDIFARSWRAYGSTSQALSTKPRCWLCFVPCLLGRNQCLSVRCACLDGLHASLPAEQHDRSVNRWFPPGQTSSSTQAESDIGPLTNSVHDSPTGKTAYPTASQGAALCPLLGQGRQPCQHCGASDLRLVSRRSQMVTVTPVVVPWWLSVR